MSAEQRATLREKKAAAAAAEMGVKKIVRKGPGWIATRETSWEKPEIPDSTKDAPTDLPGADGPNTARTDRI